eukprot:7642002-Alexandrium_andersonii.AAC.1
MPAFTGPIKRAIKSATNAATKHATKGTTKWTTKSATFAARKPAIEGAWFSGQGPAPHYGSLRVAD